jgi:hypothetical protein
MFRSTLGWLVISCFLVGSASANGTLTGKLELPKDPPARPAPEGKGFLDRIENPLAPVKPVAATQRMVIVLLGTDIPMSPPQVVIELLGDSFSRGIAAAPAGAEVVIKNVSKTARTLSAAEDPKLIPQGPINPTGPKSFRVNDVDKVYTISDKDAPHLQGKLVVVPGKHVTTIDDVGRFSFPDVPEGTYKLRVFYNDAWIDGATDVSVGKGKTEVNPKLPAIAPARK